jgi:drug/metabolite transporter (DMT)-like permease
MFFNRAFLKLVPHPLFVSFVNGAFVIPFSFIAAWAAHQFNFSCITFLPPRGCIFWLGAGALVESAISISFTLSYYVSALDFVIIMRLSGLVWNGVFGFLFLGERISVLAVLCVILIVFGILIVFSNFQWSVDLLTSKIQIIIQLVSIFLTSLGSLITKKILLVIDKSDTQFSILDYLAWSAFLSLPSTFFISRWEEPDSWQNLSSIVTWTMIGFSIFGTLLHQLLHFMVAQVHKRASLISMGVLSQVKLLGALWISHFVYKETNWDKYNFTGLGLLILGGTIYSLTRIDNGKNGARKLPSEAKDVKESTQVPIFEEEEVSMEMDSGGEAV